MTRRWNALTRRLPHDRDIIGAEIGVWEGKMSEQLLTLNPRLFLLLVDRWCVPPVGDSYFEGSKMMSRQPQEVFDHAFKIALSRVEPYADRVKVYKMTSIQAAAYVGDESLDFVFIDGDHSYKGVTADLVAWTPKVKPGGIISGHDFDNAGTLGDVRGAVQDFFGTLAGVEVDVNKTWFRVR